MPATDSKPPTPQEAKAPAAPPAPPAPEEAKAPAKTSRKTSFGAQVQKLLDNWPEPVEVGPEPNLPQEECEKGIALCAELRKRAEQTIRNLTAEHSRHYAVPEEKDPVEEFQGDNDHYYASVRREQEEAQAAEDRMQALRDSLTPEKREEILAAIG